MALIVAPIFFIAIILYVAYPLLSDKKESAVAEDAATDWEVALKKKEDVLAILKDIEMDYRMGKLSDEDYESLKARHQFEAVEALRAIEKLEKRPS